MNNTTFATLQNGPAFLHFVQILPHAEQHSLGFVCRIPQNMKLTARNMCKWII